MITVEQCCCGYSGCSYYWLKGIGKFVQGSGFTKEEAETIAELLNSVKHGQRTNYNDVYQFHQRFGLLAGTKPRRLTKRKLIERIEFMQEELNEFEHGCGLDRDLLNRTIDDGRPQNIGEQADALIDLVYVAMGTAIMMGLPWQALWDDVHRANMSKVRGTTHRGHKVDVTKPEGWIGPDGEIILFNYGYDPMAPEVDDETN